MKQEISSEKFDAMLLKVLEEQPVSSLIQIPGVYEAVAEEFNNAVIERIESGEEPEDEVEPDPSVYWSNYEIRQTLVYAGELKEAKEDTFPSVLQFWVFNTNEIPPNRIREFLRDEHGATPYAGGPGQMFGGDLCVEPWIVEGWTCAQQRHGWDV